MDVAFEDRAQILILSRSSVELDHDFANDLLGDPPGVGMWRTSPFRQGQALRLEREVSGTRLAFHGATPFSLKGSDQEAPAGVFQ